KAIQRVGTRDALDFRACEGCGASARFIGLEPDPHGSGATLCTYECEDCGELQTELMARPIHANRKSRRAVRPRRDLTMPLALNRVLPTRSDPVEFPICRACGDQMRLAHVSLHDSDRNASLHTYECACGYRILRTATR